jgi:alpha-galactosidase
LDGGGDTLVFLATSIGAPELAYWGSRLEDLSGVSGLTDRPVGGGGLDAGEALTWAPEAGQGFTGHPGLLAHREGHELITQFNAVKIDAAQRGARILLADIRAEVELILEFTMDARAGVLGSRSTLRNLGHSALTVDWFSAGAFPSPHAEILTFDGRWAREFTPVRHTLRTGLLLKENRTGRTSHHAPPFLVAGEAGFGEARGEVFGIHLAWSGDHRLFAERLRDGRIQIQGGELFHPGEMILAPGESYSTPTLHLARSDSGLNGLSDRFHPFVRNTIMAGRLNGRPRPVHYNTWEAIYFDHDLGRLKALADRAASIGIERFVLDDGWSAGRLDDRAGLGDWRPDPRKYPEGLDPLIKHVRGLGLEFGLWVEPEMVNADSDLFRDHPDWVLGDAGRRQPLGRGQYVLDFSRAEVSETIFSQLDTLLAGNAIAYLKWDMNRDLTHAVSGGRAATHRQTLAVYALIDRLREAIPAWR